MKIRDSAGDSIAYKCDYTKCGKEEKERERMLWIQEHQFCGVKCWRAWQKLRKEKQYNIYT